MSQTDGAPRLKLVDGIPWPIPPAGREWLTVNEVAERLEVPPKRVREWMTSGLTVGEIGQRRRVLLRRVGIGRQIRLYPQSVHDFLRACSLAPCEASAPAPVEGDEQRAARLAAAEAEVLGMGLMS